MEADKCLSDLGEVSLLSSRACTISRWKGSSLYFENLACKPVLPSKGNEKLMARPEVLRLILIDTWGKEVRKSYFQKQGSQPSNQNSKFALKPS